MLLNQREAFIDPSRDQRICLPDKTGLSYLASLSDHWICIFALAFCVHSEEVYSEYVLSLLIHVPECNARHFPRFLFLLLIISVQSSGDRQLSYSTCWKTLDHVMWWSFSSHYLVTWETNHPFTLKRLSHPNFCSPYSEITPQSPPSSWSWMCIHIFVYVMCDISSYSWLPCVFWATRDESTFSAWCPGGVFPMVKYSLLSDTHT